MQYVNNLPNMKIHFEKEMGLKVEGNENLFLQYYQAKMLDGIFNELSRNETIIQKLNWINDSIRNLKEDDGKPLNG